MTPLPVTAEARGAVRAFKAKLVRADRRFAVRFASAEASREAERYQQCGPRGARRASAKLNRWFGLPDRYVGDSPVWAHLRPRDAVIVTKKDPGQAQDAVVLEYLTVSDEGDLETGLWTLEIPDHALCRAAQRRRGIDLRAAILDAHRNLLAIRCDPLPQGDVLVRAGPGCFVGQMIYGQEIKGGIVVYYRPRTWLHEDQLGDGQAPLPTYGPGQPWADGPLLPFPHRRIIVAGGYMSVHRRVA